MILLQAAILFLYNSLSPFFLSRSIDSLLSSYRAAVFADLESIVSPDVYVYVEKACNFGIFDRTLRGSPSALLRKSAGRLRPAAAEAARPCAILSPFLPEVEGMRCFYYSHSTEGRFPAVRGSFFRMLEALKESGVESFRNEMVEYSAEHHPEYVLYRLELKGAGEYLETEFRGRNELMEALGRVRERLRRMGRVVRSTELLDLGTRQLVEMLGEVGVLKGKLDFEEFPELVGQLFPFRMLRLAGERGEGQLMTIGVDLSWVREEKVFDVRKHSLRYFMTFEV